MYHKKTYNYRFSPLAIVDYKHYIQYNYMVNLPPEMPRKPEASPAPKLPEIKKSLDEATGIGRGLIVANGDRERLGYSFSLKPERIPTVFLSAIKDRTADEPITEEEIQAAKAASFGITLEAARAIKDGDVYSTGRINDDPDNLETLGRCLQAGEKLGTELAVTDSAVFLSTAKQVLATQLGKNPEEIQMTPEQIAEWVKGNYSVSTPKLFGMASALRDYLGIRF